ncbi:MotA/TolQ/ExbB proton channel family protein [Sphingomonas flavalba]|uniref:MotA/TolQ/ExbB proton channel family protein n=1 Tax=Sphingomonas flavalba TaxID=2559804 RepID=UPI0039E1CB5C
MLIQLMAAAGAAAPAGENPYGLVPALQQGGIIAWATFVILVVMSVFSFYILFTKLYEQQRILNQTRRVRASFWNLTNLKDGAAKLEKNSAYRQIVDDAIAAQEQHAKLTDSSIEAHDWMDAALGRSRALVSSSLEGGGLPFLATVGATAPFIGLFGTVVGIYRALIKIGLAGQASIDAVAGPVGEALIMTALGLVVAVPAVLAYNWLQRRNKVIAEDLAGFASDVQSYLSSSGNVRPVAAKAAAPARPAAAAPARPAAPGNTPPKA